MRRMETDAEDWIVVDIVPNETLAVSRIIVISGRDAFNFKSGIEWVEHVFGDGINMNISVLWNAVLWVNKFVEHFASYDGIMDTMIFEEFPRFPQKSRITCGYQDNSSYILICSTIKQNVRPQ